MKKQLAVLTAATLLVLGASSVDAATGEVFKSGTTWTGRVDGSTKYTGSSMNAAIQACINAMSSGTVNIKNSGNADASYGVAPKNGVWLNYNGVTVNGNRATSVVQVDNKSNIRIDNLKMSGSPRYGVWVRTSSTITLGGCSHSGGGLPFRIDDSKGGWSRNVNANSPTSIGATAHGFETYGVDGFYYGTVTARDSSGCGLLLNKTVNSSGGTVNAYNCNYGGGYAGFRCANSNGKGSLGTANSDRCGRGIFSVTQSRDMTVNNCLLQNCSGIGIWLQDTYNTRINAGTVRNNGGGCKSITGGSGNVINVACQ
ncbi:MAG TPA: right-handed parallel beta-helix repeat-containing protein [Verrucomicrobiae bacterium]|nr:right-handed parallel beta-helix repeat-containing protein [Verrucomicrobiae bacterium]